ETADGRTIESLGPLVAGFRLASSKSAEAYAAIVYKKGAIVLDMLADVVGQERFLDDLGRIVRAVAGRRISAEELPALRESPSGVDRDHFAARYAYGSRRPAIVNDFRVAEEGGRGVIEVTARQGPSSRRRWAAERA